MKNLHNLPWEIKYNYVVDIQNASYYAVLSVILLFVIIIVDMWIYVITMDLQQVYVSKKKTLYL